MNADERAEDGASESANISSEGSRVDDLCAEVESEEWKGFYLKRLERLVALEEDLESRRADPDEERDWKARLLRKAIYCSFCDCIALDVKDEARELLKETVKRA